MLSTSVANLLNYGVVCSHPFHGQLFRTLLVTKYVVRNCKPVYDVHGVHTNCNKQLTKRNVDKINICERLEKLFDFTDEEAKKFYSENPLLSMNHLKCYETVRHKFSSNVIKQNTWIINCSIQKFRSKLSYLTEMGVNPLSLCVAKLGAVGPRSVDLKERIDFFLVSLQCDEDDVLNMFKKHRSLLNMDLERLRRVVALLIEHGVAKESIQADLWTLYRNEDKMKQRLKVAQSVGLTPIKPWLLRCGESHFQSVIEKKKEINDILGVHKDLVGYFAERLSCSEDDVRSMADRFEGLLAVNVPKVKRMMDTLILEFGFTSNQIQQFPFVFDHSVSTLRHRYAELSKGGCSTIHLHYLCLNNNQFRNLLKKLKRNY